jgi:choline-sulfatase
MRSIPGLVLTLGLAALACHRTAPAQPAPDARAQPAPAQPAPAQPPPAPPPAQPARPPADLNVLLLSVDSLRADMPWAGYPRPIAPFLTELASRPSVSYTKAYALSSYTSQSVGGFLGGRLPERAAPRRLLLRHVPRRVVFFPERLQAAGIRTIAAQSHGYFRAGHAGFEQGFDVWRMVPDLHWNATTDVDITSVPHADLAIRSSPSRPTPRGRFFAWFHFMDPHDQYQAHPGCISYGRRMRDRYDGEVTFTDQQVERLVTFIRSQPFGARTAIVITADHGESFGEHGHYRHAFQLWQQLVRVPWFFVDPGRRAAAHRRQPQPRRPRAHPPRALRRAPEPEFTGRSLVPELLGAEPEARDVWVDLARTGNNDRRRALIHGQYKLTAYGDDSRFELYDIEADPGSSPTSRAPGPTSTPRWCSATATAQPGIRVENPYACRTLRGAPAGRGW